MYARKSRKPAIVTLLILVIAVSGGGLLYINYLNSALELYDNSRAQAEVFFQERVPSLFISSAANAAPYAPPLSRSDALYSFNAPEGFTILSYSEPWDREMLELLYEELKLNTHGKEIEKLYEITVYPHENDHRDVLASYSPDIATADFIIQFPALKEALSARFPIYTGKINIYGGDSKTTIESIAGSLSHEYGHHYTFYYMFDDEMRRDGQIGESEYAVLREAEKYDLIPSLDLGQDYFQHRHRYIIETAAEDYVTLMGSPTTRQVIDYYDVKQLADNAELEQPSSGARNAFPQENMTIPLATEVPELNEYFHSFIDAEPRVPIEERQEITLKVSRESVQHRLSDGLRTFVYYTITWNTPYKDAIYTVACFDPYDYSGWGTPIKTVHPRQTASAIIGNYAAKRGNTIISSDDGLAHGIKVIYVVAQLPDGTYYLSEKYEFNFG